MSAFVIVPDSAAAGRTDAPSLAPDPAIDIARLSDFAGGDAATMRELLLLFSCEIDILVARMASEPPREAAARAHTLAVAARSLGASHVAQAAHAFEDAASQPGTVVLAGAMNRLSSAATDAQAEIESLTANAAVPVSH